MQSPCRCPRLTQDCQYGAQSGVDLEPLSPRVARGMINPLVSQTFIFASCLHRVLPQLLRRWQYITLNRRLPCCTLRLFLAHCSLLLLLFCLCFCACLPVCLPVCTLVCLRDCLSASLLLRVPCCRVLFRSSVRPHVSLLSARFICVTANLCLLVSSLHVAQPINYSVTVLSVRMWSTAGAEVRAPAAENLDT